VSLAQVAADRDFVDARRRDMRQLMERLYPVCRSLTGPGVRETLQVLAERMPLRQVETPSGTQVFDWTVPDEWTPRGARITDASGRVVADLLDHTLHLVGYSVPFAGRLTRDELAAHVHTLPEHPTWIPYRTSYYTPQWGFCLTQLQWEAAGDGPFDVVVDTSLAPGGLVYGELVIPGSSEQEVLVSAHVCHPSLANDNLSGIVVATELARALSSAPRRLTYRLVFAPGTIGSLVWLSGNRDRWSKIRHGLVLTGLGGGGPLVYKRTRRGDRPVDAAVEHVVRRRGGAVRDYSPWGYDERQYNALGFDLPVGRLTRTPHGEYPEYHTSADDLDFVGDDELAEAFDAVVEVVDVLEGEATYSNASPFGEPQLGKRGLYPSTGGESAGDEVLAMLWCLACSDSTTGLLAIAERAELPFAAIRSAADRLLAAGLLREAAGAGGDGGTHA
jgi:aminopeptidase-like protein